MRRGSIHIITKLVSGRIEIDIHEDKGKGPHHQIITKNRKIVKLKETIMEKIEEHRKAEEEKLKMILTGKKVKHTNENEIYYCPFHKECPYFKKENLLCTLTILQQKIL